MRKFTKKEVCAMFILVAIAITIYISPNIVAIVIEPPIVMVEKTPPKYECVQFASTNERYVEKLIYYIYNIKYCEDVSLVSNTEGKLSIKIVIQEGSSIYRAYYLEQNGWVVNSEHGAIIFNDQNEFHKHYTVVGNK